MTQTRALVFLSWSKERSKKMALALRDWLPQVLQAVEPFMSEEDTPLGSQWFEEIGKRLERADFSILCVTPENCAERWLNFEAGAIAMTRAAEGDRRRAAPYVFDMKLGELTEPLALLQGAVADKSGTLSMLRTLNQQLPTPLDETVLAKAFEMWWPALDAALAEVGPPSDVEAAEIELRPVPDQFDEMLALTRSIDRRLAGLEGDTALLRFRRPVAGSGLVPNAHRLLGLDMEAIKAFDEKVQFEEAIRTLVEAEIPREQMARLLVGDHLTRRQKGQLRQLLRELYDDIPSAETTPGSQEGSESDDG